MGKTEIGSEKETYERGSRGAGADCDGAGGGDIGDGGGGGGGCNLIDVREAQVEETLWI